MPSRPSGPSPGPDFLARFLAPAPAAPEPDPAPPVQEPPAPEPERPPSFLAAFAAPTPEPVVEAPAAAPPAVPVEPAPVVEAPPKGAHPNNRKVKVNKRTKLPSAAAPWNPKYRKPEPSLADRTLETIRQMGTTPEGTAELMKWLQAEKARASFAEFVKQAWHVVEPSTKLQWNWHHQLICCVLQALFMDWMKAQREEDYLNACKNAVFNVPPGSLKSRLIAVCFHAWVWLHWPGFRIIALSVNLSAAMRDARDARTLMSSAWYLETFHIAWNIKGDQDAVSDFGNTEGGVRLSLPSKAVVVGVRGDCILIDDANDPDSTQKDRDEVNERWDTTQFNRVNDGMRSLRLGVQQRTHSTDWTAHVLEIQGTWPDKPDGWLHVVLPAEFEAERRFVLPEPLAKILREHLPASELVLADPRTKEGETIDVRRFSYDYLKSERERTKGTGYVAGQLQQRPALAEGAKVQRQWWGWCRLAGGVREHFDEVELGRPRPAHCHNGDAQVVHAKVQSPGNWDFDWMTISVDPAAKKTDKGSNYGILVIAGKGGRRYVIDDRTQRGAFHEICDILKEMIRFWEPDSILIEPKAAGPDIMDELKKSMGDGTCPVVAIEEAEPGNSDKEMRLEACLSYIKNGMVHLLDGAPWLEEFVEELSLFPVGPRSDRVDALSQALNFVRGDEDYWPGL